RSRPRPACRSARRRRVWSEDGGLLQACSTQRRTPVSDLDSLFDGLRGQRPPTPFAAPEEVRRRGRGRKRRQVLLAGVAALAVAGSGGWAATQVIASSSSGHPQATAPLASGEQTPSTLQDAHDSGGRALTAADLGPGWEEAGHELLEGPWFWGECDGF